MPDNITRADLDRIDAKLDVLSTQLTRLQAMQDTEADRCPHREAIARAANNRTRLIKVEEHVDKMRMTWAKLGGAAVIAGAVGSLIGQPLAQAIQTLLVP